MRKAITILGSTGSIGTQALDVIRENRDRFRVVGLSCGQNIALLREQIREFSPEIVGVSEETDAKDLRLEFPKLEVVSGANGLNELAIRRTDMVLVAIVGTTSLMPTYLAIDAGYDIGLACKEVLVSAGDIIMAHATKKQVAMLPVDSEHAALKQCLSLVNGDISQVERVTITASGGPFREWATADLSNVTPELALKHPNWDMGGKITIDSSTMMNKGLEVIEAHYLFDLDFDDIDAVIHPQSIIHALAEFKDGNVVSHMGLPDMRYPIQYAMSYPEKYPSNWPRMRLTELGALTFEPVDFGKFRLFKVALDAGRAGGVAPAVMNAANEVAVGRFLRREIGYLDIIREVENALERFSDRNVSSIQDIVALDAEVKRSII
ncbi:MAG: 1-deoxy-D-xylulose-5-phosphate reductoisomerase [bacterium]|nr:1-deoxy-D-xylulose-5-phosphate reductoisomerase [bacterium]